MLTDLKPDCLGYEPDGRDVFARLEPFEDLLNTHRLFGENGNATVGVLRDGQTNEVTTWTPTLNVIDGLLSRSTARSPIPVRHEEAHRRMRRA